MERGGGKLLLCATPIGNLGDVTLRVLDALKHADIIAAEDTRRTRRLLSRHDIHTPLVSYREENREKSGARLLEALERGKLVALVSDAGTPGISDPGHDLVVKCIERGLAVEALPGANAALCALVVSGLDTRRFAFEGFLPRKRGARRRALDGMVADGRTLIFYESPPRVGETLLDIEEVMGDRRVAVARELTKRFEQVARGRVSEVREEVTGATARGEYVIVVEGSTETLRPSMEDALEEVRLYREEGLSLKDAVGRVAVAGSGISRSELYNLALKRVE